MVRTDPRSSRRLKPFPRQINKSLSLRSVYFLIELLTFIKLLSNKSRDISLKSASPTADGLPAGFTDEVTPIIGNNVLPLFYCTVDACHA